MMSRPSDFPAQLWATARWLREAKSAGVSAGDATRAMRAARSPRLNAAQRRRVRNLVEYAGYDREHAIAWVLALDGNE